MSEIVICSIAKYENDYIQEWVDYHLNIGFSKIYIHDNNEIDGEKISDVLADEKYREKVIIIDVRGQKYVQKKVYNDFYYNYDFDWCAFIDIDEFITFSKTSKYTNISAFLAARSQYEAVHLNWKCYGDNGNIKKSNRSIFNRFPKPIKPLSFGYTYKFPENNHIKSIIKKGLQIDWINDDKWESSPHTPWGLTNICDACGNRLNENSPFHAYNFDVAYIRHYCTKTIAEYTVKIIRQCADCEAEFYSFSKFYRANKITICKLFYQAKIVRRLHIPGYNNTIKGCIVSKYKYLVQRKRST